MVSAGIHATLYPAEASEHGGAHAVVREMATRRGPLSWPIAPPDTRHPSMTAGESTHVPSLRAAGTCCQWTAICGPRCRRCAGARNTARSARSGGLTVSSRGCAAAKLVVTEIRDLRRRGFRFVLLADDNFIR